ncbi:hypothetical protein E2C01_058632 [Portunus trituberculatus]|uniref:Uncharacterized protein n=1 Tax=Portunus trituberculatus TaxID=210409 RepID=A0A5B7H4G9_PORTR|nr:hypothetical protein [Portunus trituberculatus]
MLTTYDVNTQASMLSCPCLVTWVWLGYMQTGRQRLPLSYHATLGSFDQSTKRSFCSPSLAVLRVTFTALRRSLIATGPNSVLAWLAAGISPSGEVAHLDLNFGILSAHVPHLFLPRVEPHCARLMKSPERIRFWDIVIMILCNGEKMGTRGLRVGVRLCNGSQRAARNSKIGRSKMVAMWWRHRLVCTEQLRVPRSSCRGVLPMTSASQESHERDVAVGRAGAGVVGCGGRVKAESVWVGTRLYAI